MTSIAHTLRESLINAVSSSIEPGRQVGIAFSGGVDSSLLAKICESLGAEMILLTVGFAGASDLEFSETIANTMGLRHKLGEISESEFGHDVNRISALISCKNTSHIENCIAYRYIAKLAAQNGIDRVLSANGLDELFCGYNGYRAAFDLGGEGAVLDLMEQKLANELELVSEIRTVAAEMRVLVEQPFLSQSFAEFAQTIPVREKIHGGDDLLRKHIIRRVAMEIGVPEVSAMRPKKALQYGSLIHKNFKKVRRNASAGSASDE